MKRSAARVRFLPITIFAATLMLSVKIGSIWDGFAALEETGIAVAGAEAQSPEAVPAELPEPTPEPTPEPQVTEAVESIEAPPAPERTTPAQMPMEDPTLLTQTEIDLLQQLAERREVLDARAKEMEMREAMLQAAESRIDKKIDELKVLQGTIEELMAAYDEEQDAKVASLVKIYENMKPKDAARIFEQLDMDTLLMVAERMKERVLAPIMADMDPGKARDITVDLARRQQLPQDDVSSGG